jgi:Terminase small subunit
LSTDKPSLETLMATKRSERASRTSKAEAKARRDRLGRFRPGRSGNPAGRPRDMERRRRFIEAYIATVYRGARAARLAGCPTAGARVAAYRMLREPDVQAVLDQHFREEQARRRLFC